MTFSVGLFGLGKIGAQYDFSERTCMTHLRAITRSKLLKLEFAYDPNIDVGLGRKLAGDQFVFNEKNLIKKIKDIDLAVIAAPTENRRDLFEKIIDSSRVQKIFCEKPLGLDFIETKRILQLCNQKQIDVKLNFQRRHLPGFRQVGELLGDFKSGSKASITVTYSGGFTQNAIHFIDLILFWAKFLKPELKSVTGDPASDNCTVNFAIGNYDILLRPNTVETVTEFNMIILTDSFKIEIGNAGRTFSYYTVEEDPDFQGTNSYSYASTKQTEYLLFMKHVYHDVENWLRISKTKNSLCRYNEIVVLNEFLEEIQNVYVGN